MKIADGIRVILIEISSSKEMNMRNMIFCETLKTKVMNIKKL